MEEYKKKEIAHYDKIAREWKENPSGDIEGIDVLDFSSYRKLYELLKKYVPGKHVLDYGCGHGMHSVAIAKMGAAEVVGIDLSRESLAIAEARAEKEAIAHKVKFLAMDAEALEFPDNSFDVVFDGGAFSSLDVQKAFPEIKRVLKPNGYLIGIETLGHHPLANLKRWLNKKRGVRTEWAAEHIVKIKDIKTLGEIFAPTEAYFYHFISLATLPFVNLPGGPILNKLANGADKIIFALFPFLKRYGFKAVFVYQKRTGQNKNMFIQYVYDSKIYGCI